MEYTKLEASAIESYIADIYSKKVPEPNAPTKKELSFWNIAGIEAVLFTIAGIGIAIYSAIRTGGLFYIMETLLLREFNLSESVISIFSLSAMITSLAAFELYVLADGFSKGRMNAGIKRSNIGLYSSLGVIVLAGIFTGFGLIPNLDESFKMVFYTVVAISTALAGGLVALFSGENIGFTFSRVERVRREALGKHREEYQKWRESGVKAYNSSHYALGSKKSTLFVKSLAEAEKTRAVETPVFDHSEFSNNYSEPENEVSHETQEIVEEDDLDFKGIEYNNDHSKNFVLIYNNIMGFVKKNSRLPTSTELEKLGGDKTQTYLAFSQFIISNEAYLAKANLIDDKNIVRAKKYLELNLSKKI